MIQSGKFDSFMQIKNGFEKIKDFAIKKFIEFIGILTLIFAFLILLSLISYNPNDPNFIYPENQEIKNFLGIYGSIGSDFLLQSIGLIAYFLPITLIFLSLTLIFQKTLISILNSFFYIVCYSIVGTIFLTQFYKEAFFLVINGNGGFVGNYFYNNIFFKITNVNTEISYYFLIILFVISFIISINFKLEWFSILKSFIKRKKTFSSIKTKEYVKDEFSISGDTQ